MTESLLLVDERYDFLNLMEVILESEFEFRILKANSASEATHLLQQENNIKAILSYPLQGFNDSENDSEENHYLFNIKNKNIPFIVYSGDVSRDQISKIQNDNQFNSYIDNPLDEEGLYKTISRFFHASGQSYQVEATTEGHQFTLKKVQTKLLGLFSKKSFDLYIKLNGEKFVQVARKGNDDLQELTEHYKLKGVEFLYLKEDDYGEFLHTAKDMISINTQDRIKSGQQKYTTVEIFDFTYQVSRDQLSSLNISRMQEDLVNSAIADIIQDLQSDKDVYSLFKDYFANKNYLSDHSLLIIYFSSMLLNKLNWNNEQTLKQVIFASFFHDMFIPEHLARVKNLNEVATLAEKEEVLAHIKKAGNVLETIRGINNDAHKIITDHHERPDGTGFPHGLTANQIPPLSCVFLISHHIVDYLYDVNFNTSSLADFIQSMQGEWDEGNFKRVFTSARNLLLD